MQISNDWFVAETEFENKSFIIRGRLFLDAIRQSGKFATRIALVWEYQGDEKGMPTEKETQALDSLNEKLRDILEEKEIAILTAIHIGGKTARYEYYGISAEKFSIVLNETFNDSTIRHAAMSYKRKRITVKIGSNVLARPDGTLDITRMSALTDQIAELHKAGVEIIVISSGAVASGRSELKIHRKLDAVSARQLFSAVGQAKLINRYYELFREHNIACGQVLTTKENFSTRRQYLTQKQCMEVMLENKVIPIVNENDTISVTELMFTDNDELSGLISAMMDSETLVILSNIDGIYNGAPGQAGSKVIPEIHPGQELSQYIQSGKSSFGRGGMLTKCNIARKVADEGIEVIIANGKKENILPDLLRENSSAICTRFIPSANPISSIKRWIAHSEGFAKGELHINVGAVQAIHSQQAVSILPVGVTRIEGDFEKDDIVRIIDPDGNSIGVGRIAFDSETAREFIGHQGAKPFVHYDYLYLD